MSRYRRAMIQSNRLQLRLAGCLILMMVTELLYETADETSCSGGKIGRIEANTTSARAELPSRRIYLMMMREIGALQEKL